MKIKVAKALLRQGDPRQRRRMILTYWGVLLALVLGHSYFSDLTSPLKLIPQMITAILMGYAIICIILLRQFTYVAEFIDWEKVTESAGPCTGGNAVPPRASD